MSQLAVVEVAQKLSASLVPVLETMTGGSFLVDVGDEEKPDGVEWWRFTAQGKATGSLLIGATREHWLALGKLLLEAAEMEFEETSARETWTETLTQAAAGYAQELTAAAQGEVTLSLDADAQTASSPAVRIRIKTAEGAEIDLFAGSDLVLGRAEPVKEVKAEKAMAAIAGQSAGMAAAVGASSTFDLLLDVELPVSVSFGRAELPIKEVMKLASGSIIELNRHVSEPVELIVNNCVIARGEVVVIEGNYGIRIQQIISPQERLRTLK